VQIFQKHKKPDDLTVFFALLGSALEEAESKMLVKSTLAIFNEIKKVKKQELKSRRKE